MALMPSIPQWMRPEEEEFLSPDEQLAEILRRGPRAPASRPSGGPVDRRALAGMVFPDEPMGLSVLNRHAPEPSRPAVREAMTLQASPAGQVDAPRPFEPLSL